MLLCLICNQRRFIGTARIKTISNTLLGGLSDNSDPTLCGDGIIKSMIHFFSIFLCYVGSGWGEGRMRGGLRVVFALLFVYFLGGNSIFLI